MHQRATFVPRDMSAEVARGDDRGRKSAGLTVRGSYHRHPRSDCTSTLTLTLAHYFLMSNRHSTGAQDRHGRQLIAHGNPVGHLKPIRK